MAKQNPNEGSGNPDPNDPKSKDNLPEWLRTDDWLQITPPPIRKQLPDSPSGRGIAGDEQATDMIELDEGEDSEDVDVPPSTMLFSDPDDSVILTDELLSSGPPSGKLQAGSSGINLPQPGSTVPVGDPERNVDSKFLPDLAEPPSSAMLGADDAIELGILPPPESQLLAGPSTSGVYRPKMPPTAVTPITPIANEDAIGQPLKPTQPASGWLGSSTKLPETPPPAGGSKSRMPSVPSVSNLNSTWAELDLPAPAQQPPAKAPEKHPDSWHPSSGNIGVPSSANIDLPPEEGEGSDIFSKATRPGPAPVPLKIEIPKPKPIRSEGPKAPAAPIPASPSFELPPMPDVPASQPKGSWHPSSGNVMIPSTGDIDLPPPAEGSDIFKKSDAAARTPEPKKAAPAVPSLSKTNFDILPEPAKPGSTPSVPLGLEPTSDFKSSADIDLPPEKTEGASDIFSTATKPKATSTTGGSGIFSGAEVPDSSLYTGRSGSLPGDSNLFSDLAKPAPASPKDAGRVDLTPPGLEMTGELNLSQLLPGSQSGSINFALPTATGDSRASSIEVVDTSGTLDGAKGVEPYPALRADELLDEGVLDAEDASLEAELDRQIRDDDGRPDFNYLPGTSASDSNILGDRTMSEQSRSGPHSSSVNLDDPLALSSDPAVDSGQPSSIFNKMDQSTQASGHVDLDEIPLMGSSDSGTMPVDTGRSAVFGGRLDEPLASDLDESVFDVTMPKDEAADSGMIDWSADAAKVTDRLGMQASMEGSRHSEQSSGGNQPSLPISPRKASAPRPTSRPEIDLDAVEPQRAPAKPRSAILASALSLLAGAGIGAGAMFLAGGNSSEPGTKADPAAVAKLNEATSKLTAAESAAAEAKKQVEALNVEKGALKASADAGAKAVADLKVATVDKQKLEADFADAKKKAEAAELAAKKLNDEKVALLGDVKKATDDAAKFMVAATDAKKDAEEKGKLLDSAKVAADAAAAKLKAADGLLDPVLEKLKAAKLIDDKADRAKALAALPDALKKANLITGEGEVAKLAKEIGEARELLKTQKDDADKKLATAMSDLTAAKKESEKQLADAKVAAQKAMADLQAKVDTADKRIVDEVKKAVTDATKEAKAKLVKAQETLAAEQRANSLALQKEKTTRENEAKVFEAKLAERAEQFEKQLATARAGVVVPLSDLAVAKSERSANAYDAGSTAYFAGRYAEAEKAFADAAKAEPSDARFWYYLGLSKFAQGKTTEAAADFKTGGEWESRAKPGRRAVAAALERIQGPARIALEAARP